MKKETLIIKIKNENWIKDQWSLLENNLSEKEISYFENVKFDKILIWENKNEFIKIGLIYENDNLNKIKNWAIY